MTHEELRRKFLYLKSRMWKPIKTNKHPVCALEDDRNNIK